MSFRISTKEGQGVGGGEKKNGTKNERQRQLRTQNEKKLRFELSVGTCGGGGCSFSEDNHSLMREDKKKTTGREERERGLIRKTSQRKKGFNWDVHQKNSGDVECSR